MDLPPVEELSRWTVGHVNNWLTKSSLTAFRDFFLNENVDGSKLMRLQPHEIDQKYKSVPVKKRNILKDHLSKIESSRSPPAWNAAPPQLPPRPRQPAPAPNQTDDGDGSDDGWGSEDFDDDIDEEYLEPASPPPHLRPLPVPGPRSNGHHGKPPPDPGLEAPQTEYEIPLEDIEEINNSRDPAARGVRRSSTLVDQLRNELEIRKQENQGIEEEESSDSDSDGGSYIEPAPGPVDAQAPPPRPPRSKALPEAPDYRNTPAESPKSPAPPQPPPGRHRPPPQPAAPEAEYEIVSNVSEQDEEYLVPDITDCKPNNYLDFSETSKKAQENPRRTSLTASGSAPLPPRPVKKVSTDKPPQQGGWLFNKEQSSSASQEEDDLSKYEWYHGKITRDHAQRIFEREQKDGMFLIRKSERDPQQPYTLVLWHCSRIWNIPIRKVDNKFAAGKFKKGETEFNSIVDVVEHFKVVSLNLKSDNQVQGTHNLTVPAPKK